MPISGRKRYDRFLNFSCNLYLHMMVIFDSQIIDCSQMYRVAQNKVDHGAVCQHNL